MSYEPRGKVKTLIDAMDADPSREWNTAAAAAVMQTSLNAVHAFVERAIAAGLLHRSLNNGRAVFGRKPFTEASCVSRLPEVPTTATGWRPPTMGTPRVKATPSPQPTPEPASPPAEAEPGPDGERELNLQHSVAVANVVAGGEPEPQDDASEPATWHLWEDGDLDLFGLVELENGGYRLPAEALRRLRKFIAWMPAC